MLEAKAKTPLSGWFEKTGRTKTEFASKVGCTPGRITQICGGDTPSLSLAISIMKETNGEVSCADLLRADASAA